ncbi:putative uncharacterized protein DDB_G0271974 [Gigantopelta aegis]|uniref:putative uncharacterized protein DDB_G0271974 n=1 Tax=Gigantopelta aegis TaxID=1735272 RepID=UPI001B8874B5|nr:putative uncharacterized protein DDB_G0271974 [Gigantopelta aegis]
MSSSSSSSSEGSSSSCSASASGDKCSCTCSSSSGGSSSSSSSSSKRFQSVLKLPRDGTFELGVAQAGTLAVLDERQVGISSIRNTHSPSPLILYP